MLEQVDLSVRYPEEEFGADFDALKSKLAMLQQKIRLAKIPVVLLFEGWSASGKGRVISDLLQSLDPRGFCVYSEKAGYGDEDRYPALHQYWKRLPSKGNMAIFDRSWYQTVTVDAVEDGCGQKEYEDRFREVVNFERLLQNEGYTILRFFLHISKKEQSRRLEALEAEKATRWRVTKRDWKRQKKYEEYYNAFDRMLEESTREGAPWTIIEAEDRRWSAIKVYRAVAEQLEKVLQTAQKDQPQELLPYRQEHIHLLPARALREIDLQASLEETDYQEQLEALQRRLFTLQNRLYRKKIPLVIAYEGWDAAGKGGNIRRVTKALDPRGYRVVPIGSPSTEESSYPYLWRFWTNLPKTGHTAVFDRTWYGRVLVERVEGFCNETEWRRAYDEINIFEKELTDFGTILVKFWLHIDPAEQLKRFQERESDPEKQWKITQEDWRNREKWIDYEQAADEMFCHTSTEYAPWTIVESEDKKYARVKALQVIIEAIEKRLSD